MIDDLLSGAVGNPTATGVPRAQLAQRLAAAVCRLAASRYRFVAAAEARVVLPDPAGLALGACFEDAIHQVVCPRPGPDCRGCMEAGSCTYAVMSGGRGRPAHPWLLRLEQNVAQLDRRGRRSELRVLPADEVERDARHRPADGMELMRGESFDIELVLLGKAANRVQGVLRALLALSRVGLPSPGGGRRVPFELRRVSSEPFVGPSRTLCERSPSGRLTALRQPPESEGIVAEWRYWSDELAARVESQDPIDIELRTPLELSDELRSTRHGTGRFVDFVELALDRWEELSSQHTSSIAPARSTSRALLLSIAERVPQLHGMVERLSGPPGSPSQLRGQFRFGAGARAFLPLLHFAERAGIGERLQHGRGQLHVRDQGLRATRRF